LRSPVLVSMKGSIERGGGNEKGRPRKRTATASEGGD